MRSFSSKRALSLALLALPACGGSGATTSTGAGGASSSSTASGSASTGASMSSASTGAGGGKNLPAGWLFTNGASIEVADGKGGGTQWVGRGVNFDDVFLCGYNNSLWMTDQGASLKTLAANLVADWKPSFVRVSLGMASYPTHVSWLSNAAQYKTPMTDVITTLANGVYVMVTLRSDDSMIGQDMVDGDPEATGLPSDATTTPDKTKFPTGTDATYVALVDTFAHQPHVLFGISNEPGGNKLPNDQIRAAMDHAVATIRAEEDKLGVPHHIVSVQGNGWTSDIGFYATAPLAHDNVVYEVHGYPPAASSYTYANLPVIIGEYGSLPDSAAFYADVEAKHLSNLAWDFEPYSNCTPDLLNVTQSATNLQASPWGMTVKAYLAAH